MGMADTPKQKMTDKPHDSADWFGEPPPSYMDPNDPKDAEAIERHRKLNASVKPKPGK